MSATGVSFLALLCVCLIQVQVGANLTCSATNRSSLRVTFDSHQNQTGFWTHSVGLMNRGLPKGLHFDKTTDIWTVDVDHSPENCDKENKDSLNVLISFSIHPVVKRNPDYKFFPGIGYYKVHATLDTWAVAKANCEKEGAHLVIVNSQQEADVLKQLLVNASGVWSWVGLIKNDPKGEFTTVLGGPLSSTGFSKWRDGVDPAGATTHTAVIHKTDGKFSYDGNTAKYVSVCEQDVYY